MVHGDVCYWVMVTRFRELQYCVSEALDSQNRGYCSIAHCIFGKYPGALEAGHPPGRDDVERYRIASACHGQAGSLSQAWWLQPQVGPSWYATPARARYEIESRPDIEPSISCAPRSWNSQEPPRQGDTTHVGHHTLRLRTSCTQRLPHTVYSHCDGPTVWHCQAATATAVLLQ